MFTRTSNIGGQNPNVYEGKLKWYYHYENCKNIRFGFEIYNDIFGLTITVGWISVNQILLNDNF